MLDIREICMWYLRKNIQTLRFIEWWNKQAAPLGSELPVIVVQKVVITKSESLLGSEIG